MNESVTANPLQWPEGRPRTKRPERARFDQTFTTARSNLLEEIKRLGGKYPVISSNLETRRDGLPYANKSEPEDPGVAVYFQHQGRQVCFACDKWDRVRDNIQAVAKTIEALRGISRWGTGDMMDRAFEGFQALPGPEESVGGHWPAILGLPPDTDLEQAEAKARRLLHENHPDRGGDPDMFRKIQQAREQAREALSKEG